MQISYLKKLQENPKGFQNSNPMRGLSLVEIEQLEALWNNGNPFPIVLKEYLFLGGEFCWVFEMNSPHKLLSSALLMMSIQAPTFTMPPRPYMIIGVTTGCEHYTFIFLDETAPDPMLYALNLFLEDQMEVNDLQRIEPLGITLSEHINNSIDGFRRLQAKGYYPL